MLQYFVRPDNLSGRTCKQTKQARYQNVVNHPLPQCDPSEQVLGLVAVPELHLMLGITDKLLVALETKVFPTKEEGKAFMDDFLGVASIARKFYTGQ